MNLDELKKAGEAPSWMTSESLKTISNGYLLPDETPKGMYTRVSRAAAQKLISMGLSTDYQKDFFEAMWRNWLCPASPVLSNMGTTRGLPISCFSVAIPDSVDGIMSSMHEVAMLSKNGGGVGTHWSGVRPRGSAIRGNGRSDGVIPFMKILDSTILGISQGGVRRGAGAAYLDIDHGDFDEFIKMRRPVGDPNRQCLNLHQGVCISDSFMNRVKDGDKEARRRWLEVLKSRLETGEPYLFFTDNVNNQNPECYKRLGLKVQGSNICTEIFLFTDELHSFVCCLSSLNLEKYDEWKDTKLVELSIFFLDAVMEEFIDRAKLISGMQNAVQFAQKSRALGLGVLGFHTLLQKKNLAFDSLQAYTLNNLIFKNIQVKALKASADLARLFGEPEWCSKTGRRNSHTCVTGDTTLLTKQGYKSIKSLVGKDVEIWNGHQWTNVNPFITSENEDIFSVTLSDGSNIKVTENHKWMIKNDRSKKPITKETRQLLIGDKLDKWELPMIEGSEEFPHAYTHGFYCGDGSNNQSKPQYENCKKRKEVRLYNEDKKCLNLLEVKENCSVRTQKDGSLRFYIPDDMPGKWIVPTINHTIKSRFEWLAGLYDADGCWTGILTSAKFSFLKEIKDMLSFSGIFATIQKAIRKSGYKPGSVCYSLSISLSDLEKMKNYGFKTQRIKFRHAKINKKHYVKIEKIEKIEKSKTYCVTDPIDGTALFNGIKTRQCAVAPTASNSIISGGHSSGIEPIVANAFAQKSAKGTFLVKNPQLEVLLETKGKNDEEVWKSIVVNEGSVQHLDFLSEEEKKVFETAREINQFSIIKLAAARQKYIDQGQSINLFFPANVDAKYFHQVHVEAHKSNLKSLYYTRSSSVLKGDAGSKEYARKLEECSFCEG